MPELLVNEQKCTRCGKCIKTCPVNIIQASEGGLPGYVPGGAQRCLVCGHCESVCQDAAIRVEDPRLEAITHPDSISKISPELLGSYLRMRRSIRDYRVTPVDPAIIEQLLDIVRYAPSASNIQDVHWLVIHDTLEVRRLTGLVVDWMRSVVAVGSTITSYFNFEEIIRDWENGKDTICRGAPHLVVAHAHKDAPMARIDGIIALSHLDIVAPAFGLGTCWAGFFQTAVTYWEPLRIALGLPPDHISIYALMLGYPAVHHLRPPRRNRASISWR